MTARPALAAVVASLLIGGPAIVLAGCSGGSLSQSNQVIVHLDENSNDLVGAQRVADAECRRRGGRARFILRITNDSGARDDFQPSTPDAVFACDPAP